MSQTTPETRLVEQAGAARDVLVDLLYGGECSAERLQETLRQLESALEPFEARKEVRNAA